jgi:menaquinone-dependent protoporphyrinogen oxidase
MTMRVLITWGSKRGGTEGIAHLLGDALRDGGVDVALVAPRDALRATGFDAAIVGGALYANRWHRDARRFVSRRERDLRRVPVWFFSSGPLDDSASRRALAPSRQVAIRMERVGAQGHATFGGRLTPDASTPLAKKHAGDWRDPDRISAWASEIARALPTAHAGTVVPQEGRSLGCLVVHGAVGWALCAAVMGALLWATTITAALVVHAIVAPAIFVAIARHYFQARGARDPLPTAIAFSATVGLLDAGVVAGLVQRSVALFASVGGFWLPLALIFLATLATGELMSTLPWTKATEPTPAGGHAATAG